MKEEVNVEGDRQLFAFFWFLVFAFTVIFIVDVLVQCGKGDLDSMTMPD